MNGRLNIRVDEKIKNKADKLLEELGLDMSTAVNMFVHQIVITNGVPFRIKGKNKK